MLKLIELLNSKQWEYTLQDSTLYVVIGNDEYTLTEKDTEAIQSLINLIINW